MDRDRRYRHNVVYAADSRFVFVRVVKGFYLKTDVCVALVSCPQCGAKKGEPCITRQKTFSSSTHYVRRRAARKKR